METYFDILPEDILLILLRKERILKTISITFERLYSNTSDIISKGVINPSFYFSGIEHDGMTLLGYVGSDINVNGVYTNSDEISIIIDKYMTSIYYQNELHDWTGYTHLIFQLDIKAYQEVLSNIDKVSTAHIGSSPKVCYAYLHHTWTSNSYPNKLNASMIIDDNWNNIWDMLDQNIRFGMMKENEWI